MNKIIKRLNKFSECAKSHGIDATWFRTKSSHYSLWLSRGDEKCKPLVFSSTSNHWKNAHIERVMFKRAMRSFGIDIDNTGLSLSFHTC
jgi:hypothetical protein